MVKINSETLLRGDYLLLQKCSTELENLALPNHLQLSLFVPLPLPTPGSTPAKCHNLYFISENLQEIGVGSIYSNRTVSKSHLSSHFIVALLLNSARPHLKLIFKGPETCIITNWSGLI